MQLICIVHRLQAINVFSQNITNVTAPKETINVAGQAAGFVDTTIKQLFIYSSSQFSYFPTKLLTIFLNASTVIVDNNNMTALVTNAVDYCQALTDLTINHQLITNLPAEFAQNCVNLKDLDLSYNQIATIDDDALIGLSKLESFIFGNNKITCIPPRLFANTPHMLGINFSDNLITAIDPITFRGLPWSIGIVLSSNNIQYFPNLDMTGSSINSTVDPNLSLYGDFTQNPIIAIDPQFIPTFFDSRNHSAELFFGNNNQNTCIPKDLRVNQGTYTQMNVTLDRCYKNWKPSFVQPVACAPITTTSTTTTAPKTTTANKKISRSRSRSRRFYKNSRSRMSSHKRHRYFWKTF